MIKNLYGYQKKNQSKVNGQSKSDNWYANSALIQNEGAGQQASINQYHIFKKDSIHYNTCVAVIDYFKTNYFCCLYCCCKRSKQGKSFQVAQSKLYAEIDIFRLIKTGRLTKLLSNLELRAGQKRLINKFDCYTIKSDEEPLSSDSLNSVDFDKIDDDFQITSINAEQVSSLNLTPVDKRIMPFWKQSVRNNLKKPNSLSKFTDEQKVTIHTWLNSIGRMYDLVQIMSEVKECQNGGSEQDMLTLKQLLGREDMKQEDINTILQEMENEFEETQNSVVSKIESEQGKAMMQSFINKTNMLEVKETNQLDKRTFSEDKLI